MASVGDLDINSLGYFCESWMRKANECPIHDLAGLYDRFFTLWVVYNRLYDEAGRSLIRRGDPAGRKLRGRSLKPFAPLSDRSSATNGVVRFLGAGTVMAAVRADRARSEAINRMIDAVENGPLYLHEDYDIGGPDQAKDEALIQHVRRKSAKHLLEFVYLARCNMFHGGKVFNEIQRPLIEGMVAVLESVIPPLQEMILAR